LSKQDRQGVRSATDLERKYGFGQSFADIYRLIDETETATREAIEEINKELDAEEIFNRLTNYGKNQAVLRDDTGNIYINATYIKSGTLDASKMTVSNLDASSITGGEIDAGKVTIKNLNADNITGGKLQMTLIEGCSVVFDGADIDYVTIDHLSATSIDCGTLNLNNLSISGTMSANRIDGGTINGSKISGVEVSGCHIIGCAITAGVSYDEDDNPYYPDGYSEMTANNFRIYDEDDTQKASIEVFPGIGDDDTECARLRLGNTATACVVKYYSTEGDNMMWVGDDSYDCGILFNFDTEEYCFFGTENADLEFNM